MRHDPQKKLLRATKTEIVERNNALFSIVARMWPIIGDFGMVRASNETRRPHGRGASNAT